MQTLRNWMSLKPSEYRTVKKQLQNFTHELDGLGSKPLSNSELMRYRSRYKRIAENIRVDNKNYSKTEYYKLQKQLTSFQNRFKSSGIMDESERTTLGSSNKETRVVRSSSKTIVSRPTPTSPKHLEGAETNHAQDGYWSNPTTRPAPISESSNSTLHGMSTNNKTDLTRNDTAVEEERQRKVKDNNAGNFPQIHRSINGDGHQSRSESTEEYTTKTIKSAVKEMTESAFHVQQGNCDGNVNNLYQSISNEKSASAKEQHKWNSAKPSSGKVTTNVNQPTQCAPSTQTNCQQAFNHSDLCENHQRDKKPMNFEENKEVKDKDTARARIAKSLAQFKQQNEPRPEYESTKKPQELERVDIYSSASNEGHPTDRNIRGSTEKVQSGYGQELVTSSAQTVTECMLRNMPKEKESHLEVEHKDKTLPSSHHYETEHTNRRPYDAIVVKTNTVREGTITYGTKSKEVPVHAHYYPTDRKPSSTDQTISKNQPGNTCKELSKSLVYNPNYAAKFKSKMETPYSGSRFKNDDEMAAAVPDYYTGTMNAPGAHQTHNRNISSNFGNETNTAEEITKINEYQNALSKYNRKNVEFAGETHPHSNNTHILCFSHYDNNVTQVLKNQHLINSNDNVSSERQSNPSSSVEQSRQPDNGYYCEAQSPVSTESRKSWDSHQDTQHAEKQYRRNKDNKRPKSYHEASYEEQTNSQTDNNYSQKQVTRAHQYNQERSHEVVEEQPLEILDVHKYFRDDFDINSIDDYPDDMTKIEKIETWAGTFVDKVKQFNDEKYSLEYFVLDEKLMRLIEKLDKLKCHDNYKATTKKVEVIEQIKQLHAILDLQAKDG